MKRIAALFLMFGMMSAYAQDANTPSTEFLEFLGEWEAQDGQWQDPGELLEIEDADLQKSKVKTVSETVYEEHDHDE